ncbi:glutathione S-transferase family protein, partial [Paracoccus sp. MKU1]
MKLFDYVLSGNCYKIRLLLDFLELSHEKQAVDFFPGREHKSDAFLQINPLGQIPVLEDDGAYIRDAQAILVYLASRYDPTGTWWPVNDPSELGRVAQWLAFADSITSTASAARLHDVLGYDLDVAQARAGAHKLFRILDDHLANQELQGFNWIAGSNPTVADVACFPYVALAGDGGIE